MNSLNYCIEAKVAWMFDNWSTSVVVQEPSGIPMMLLQFGEYADIIAYAN